MADKAKTKTGTSRRQVLKGSALAAAAIAVPTMIAPRKTRAAVRLTARDPGGPFTKAFGEAFYKPFNKLHAGEIEVVGVAGKHEPTSQIKAMVDTGSYEWDVAILSISAVDLLVKADGYLEKLEIDDEPGYQEILPEFKTPYLSGNDVYATILAYRNDVYKDMATAPVHGWKDVWDLEGIKGRRAIRKHPFDTFEEALIAQGTAPKDVYEDMRKNGFDPVFASLDKIKSAIDIWWTGGAQTSQLLTTGEVDICPTWNGRAQAAIDGGAPVTISWEQGLYSYEGWAILKGGPNVDAARKFVRFCSTGEAQANYTPHLGYGPTNPNAYKNIPAERAAVLPTAPANLEKMVQIDSEFWGKEKDRATELFNGWLLG